MLLTPKGISVRDTINNKKQDFLNEVLTGISLQIATFELFKLVGLVPTSSFGYSYGEFANAYANGTLTLEQAVLSAYHLTKLVSCVPKSENNTKEAVKSNKTNFEGIINNLKNHKLSDLGNTTVNNLLIITINFVSSSRNIRLRSAKVK